VKTFRRIAKDAIFQAMLNKIDFFNEEALSILEGIKIREEEFREENFSNYTGMCYWEYANIVEEMIKKREMHYEIVQIPGSVYDYLEEDAAGMSYYMAGIINFPGLSEATEEELKDIYENAFARIYADCGGNLIEFFCLAQSDYAISSDESLVRFTNENPYAFVVAVQDNGQIRQLDVLRFFCLVNDCLEQIDKLIEEKRERLLNDYYQTWTSKPTTTHRVSA